MPQFKQSKEVYDSCNKEGHFINQEEVDTFKIKHMAAIAQGDLDAIKTLIQNLPKEGTAWSTVYKLAYDALHQLTEAYARFDRIKSNNHQCLFAYLSEKHPELEFDWAFMEKVRTKRNGIQYYGTPTSYADWKEIELQINLYINTLKKVIENKTKTEK